MTPDEIQALREKHRSKMFGKGEKWEAGPFCSYCTFGTRSADSNISVGNPVPYPCDVITVLDAWEAERSINIGQMLNSYFNAPIYTNEDYDL